MATSYANPGGSGNRTSIITCTVSGADVFYNASYTSGFTGGGWVNGSLAEVTLFAAATVANKWLKFDFGVGASKLINETKIYFTYANHPQGVWKWQGSTDNSAWTDIGSSFTFIPNGTSPITDTSMSGNAAGYRYYRLLGVSGSSNADQFQNEIDFKIEDAAAPSAGSSSSTLGLSGIIQ